MEVALKLYIDELCDVHVLSIIIAVIEYLICCQVNSANYDLYDYRQ